jgi:CBS domain-containing protein
MNSSDASDLLSSPLLDRSPPTLGERATLSEVLELMLGPAAAGVPIVSDTGRYRGICTPRCIMSICLLINGESAALLPSLAFLRDDVDRLRRRLDGARSMPAVEALDPFVPTLRVTASQTDALFQLYRNNHIVPVIDDADGWRLVGVVTAERVIRVALDRVQPSPVGQPSLQMR